MAHLHPPACVVDRVLRAAEKALHARDSATWTLAVSASSLANPRAPVLVTFAFSGIRCVPAAVTPSTLLLAHEQINALARTLARSVGAPNPEAEAAGAAGAPTPVELQAFVNRVLEHSSGDAAAGIARVLSALAQLKEARALAQLAFEGVEATFAYTRTAYETAVVMLEREHDIGIDLALALARQNVDQPRVTQQQQPQPLPLVTLADGSQFATASNASQE